MVIINYFPVQESPVDSQIEGWHSCRPYKFTPISECTYIESSLLRIGLLMRNYQTLLGEAVALLNADRGFVVLCDPPDQYVATHNFDLALFQRPLGEELDEHQYMRQMLPDLLAAAEPILTSNAMRDSYYYRKIRLIDWVLRCIIAVQLKKEDAVYGLLWCDKSIRAKGVWSEQDLEQAATLVQQFHEML